MLRYAVLALPLLASACATVIDGSHQKVMVETSPVAAARCTLSNDEGQWTVDSTPGMAEVKRSWGPLNVECAANDYRGVSKVESSYKMLAAGSILFGVVGVGVDAMTENAYDYPDTISVTMVR